MTNNVEVVLSQIFAIYLINICSKQHLEFFAKMEMHKYYLK